MLFYDFFLGSKSDISGSFGTFLADDGGFLLNELTKHFTSDLILSFVFWRSIWATREEFCTRYSLVSLFFQFQNQHFCPFWHIFSTFLSFFLNQLPNRFGSNLFFSFSFCLRLLSFLLTFFFGSNNETLGSFCTFLAHYWIFFSEWLAKSISE